MHGDSEECRGCLGRSRVMGCPTQPAQGAPWGLNGGCGAAPQHRACHCSLKCTFLSFLLPFSWIYVHSRFWMSAVSPPNESLLCCVVKSLSIVMDLCYAGHSGTADTPKGDLPQETGIAVWTGKPRTIVRSSPGYQRCVFMTQWTGSTLFLCWNISVWNIHRLISMLMFPFWPEGLLIMPDFCGSERL